MKKIFNNSGLTLIEVVVAVIILAVIAVPIINTLIQTFKFNISSDVEMRMKAEAERVIEGVKAAKGDVVQTGTEDGKDYVGGTYYDKLFNPVEATSPNKYYKLTADKTLYNTIDTSSQYDRWDFKVGVEKNNSTRSKIYVYKHAIDSNGNAIILNSALGGKLYATTELTQSYNETGSSMTLDFQGKVDGTSTPYRFNYLVDGTNGPSSGLSFAPGLGAINSGENTIVVNLYRIDSSTGAPRFDVDVFNKTFYNGNTSTFYTIKINSDWVLSYYKNIIVNVFNDNPDSPTINVTPKSPYITINQTQGLMPVINNGYKINITINNITVNPNKTVRIVPSVVE